MHNADTRGLVYQHGRKFSPVRLGIRRSPHPGCLPSCSRQCFVCASMSNPFELAPDASAGFSAEIELDKAVTKLLPEGSTIKSAVGHGASLWTRSARIDIELADGTPKSYFIKVAPGPNGISMLRGEFHSATDMQAVLPDFSPKPIGWGVFESNEDLAFFLQFYHDMDNEIPDMDKMTKMLANFHLKSSKTFERLTAGRRPQGKRFGYHVSTHNGKLAQNNSWTSTWEEYFTQNMKTMLDHDLKKGGERPQAIEELLTPLFEKVIPRLLRPMEMDGRTVTPCLLHGDLWYGNASTDKHSNLPIVFDACCFWGHNECKPSIRVGIHINLFWILTILASDEIRTMRTNTVQGFGKAQKDAYLQHYPPAHPVEDFEARNALYHLYDFHNRAQCRRSNYSSSRSQLHDCALFPENPKYRQT
ncbi:hypothetical protein M011DRAFT_252883 [Sporormia fimetaria CBS 119925]|uniref:protein-ribulosamine 3-kinase n=1 Tax=Sporormia fimetaria CBS 119925 TaxID=1340428 RepID=A0A6A6UXQ8_9PLEO|nr:hypothetical protein M011DRAFT_252883 [Sporormia fimetaria CBS 119925]